MSENKLKQKAIEFLQQNKLHDSYNPMSSKYLSDWMVEFASEVLKQSFTREQVEEAINQAFAEYYDKGLTNTANNVKQNLLDRL